MNYTLNGKLLTTGGGPSVPTSFVNTGFSATGTWTYSRPFTATQNSGPQYATASATASLTTARDNTNLGFQLDDTSVFPLDNTPANLIFVGQYESWAQLPNTGIVYGSDVINVQGTEIGTYTSYTVSNYYTATASFTANTESFPYYIKFDGLQYWSAIASNVVTATTYTKTGEGKPYPQYDLTTTGVLNSRVEISGGWSDSAGGKVVELSRTANSSGTYLSGPSYTTGPYIESVPREIPFKTDDFSASAAQAAPSLIEDQYYLYTYGTPSSGYTGYTGY